MLRPVSAHHAMHLAVYLHNQKMYRKGVVTLTSIQMIKENTLGFQSTQVSLVCLGKCGVLEKVSVRLEGILVPVCLWLRNSNHKYTIFSPPPEFFRSLLWG